MFRSKLQNYLAILFLGTWIASSILTENKTANILEETNSVGAKKPIHSIGENKEKESSSLQDAIFKGISSRLPQLNPTKTSSDSLDEIRLGNENLYAIESLRLSEKILELNNADIKDFLHAAEKETEKLDNCKEKLCYANARDTKFRKLLNTALELKNLRGYSSSTLALELSEHIHALSGETQKIGLQYVLNDLGPQESIRALSETNNIYDPYAVSEFSSSALNHKQFDASSSALDRFVIEQSNVGDEVNALVLYKELYRLPHFNEYYASHKKDFCRSLHKFPDETRKEAEGSLYISVRLSGMSAKDMPHCRL